MKKTKANSPHHLKNKSKLSELKKTIGPGFITGSADNDPSGIGTYSMSGARFGFGQVWIIIFNLPMMIAVQEMCGRLGMVTGTGLAGNIKKHFSLKWLYLCVVFLVFANVFNIGANLAVMSSVIKLLVGGNVYFWGLFIALLIVFLELLVPYKKYTSILKWLTIPFFAYVIVAFMVPQDWGDILKALVIPGFEFNSTYIMLLVGFIGTTISPYLFFWQASEEVEEEVENKVISDMDEKPKRVFSKNISKMRIDTIVGMVFSQIIAFFIVITCASTLFKSGIFEINDAKEAALALRPLAGNWAFLLFAIGIIGAGFMGIPTLAGSAAYAVSEVFDWKQGLFKKFKQASRFYMVIVLATIFGLFINVLGLNPIKTLLYSAVINGVVSIPLIAFIILLTNNSKVMGKHKNKPISNILGWFTFGVMLLASVMMVIYW